MVRKKAPFQRLPDGPFEPDPDPPGYDPPGGGGKPPDPDPDPDPPRTRIPGGRVQPIPKPDPEPPDEPPEEWPDPIWPTPGGGGNTTHNSSFDLRSSTGSTILGATVGPVYGRRRVGAYCFYAVSASSTQWTLAYAFATGECKDISELQINDAAYTVFPARIGNISEHYGTADSLNRSSLFPASDKSNYPGLVYGAFRALKAEMPGSMNVSAILDGKIIGDFRLVNPGPVTEDFESYPTGSLPGTWSYVLGPVTFTVEDDGGGNNVLEGVATGTDSAICYWNGFGAVSDVDVTALIKVTDSRNGILTRLADDGSRFIWTYIKKQSATIWNFQCWSYNANAPTWLQWRNLYSKAYSGISEGDLIYLRNRLLGDTIKGAWSHEAAGPPANWEFHRTQTEVEEAGFVGTRVTAASAGKVFRLDDIVAENISVRTNYSNPALIAYDICTDKEMWKGLDDLEVNTDQLGEIADWCDEQIDGEERWHFHGALDIRDSDRALAEILVHCRTEPYVYDQTMYFVADMPPRPLVGNFTNTGTVFSGGADLLTTLEAGEVVLVYDAGDHYIYTVASVPNNGQFIVEETPAVVHSDVKVRKINPTYIQKDHFIKVPDGADSDISNVPDVVLVKYATESEKEWRTARCEDPDGYPAGDPKIRESTLNGIKTGGVAHRWGHHERRSLKLVPFEWEFSTGPEGSSLAPGDVFRIDTERLNGQLVRCLGKKEDILTGEFKVNVREFDMGVYSDDVADDDSPPTDYVDPVEPILPLQVRHYLIEQGDWDQHSKIANPDDLTGWDAPTPNLSVSFDSVNDETLVELTGGPHSDPYEYISLDISDYVNGFGNFLYCLTIRDADPSTYTGPDSAVRMEYWGGWSLPNIKKRGERWISPFNDSGERSLWQRCAWWNWIRQFPIHQIRIVFGSSINRDANPSRYAIKRVRLIGGYGEPVTWKDPWRLVPPTNPAYGLRLVERFEWDDAPGAEDANSVIEFWQNRGWTTQPIHIDTFGATTADKSQVHREGDGSMPFETLNLQSGSDLYWGFMFKMVSITGHTTNFPWPTQQFLVGDTPPPVESFDFYLHNALYPGGYGTPLTRFRYMKVPSSLTSSIPEQRRDDFLVELWLDVAGGTDYVKVGEVSLADASTPGINGIGFGDCPEANARQFAKANGDVDLLSYFQTENETETTQARFELRLVSLYSGLKTRMAETRKFVFLDPPPLPPDPVLTEVLNATWNYLRWVDGVPILTFQNQFRVRWDFYGVDDEAYPTFYFRFKTRNSGQAGSAVVAPWQLREPEATEASWSTTVQSVFDGELPIPAGHDEFQLVAVLAIRDASGRASRTRSPWTPILNVMSSGTTPQEPDTPTPGEEGWEPVVLADGGTTIDFGDEVVTKKNFTTEARLEQPFEFVFLDNGDLVTTTQKGGT